MAGEKDEGKTEKLEEKKLEEKVEKEEKKKAEEIEEKLEETAEEVKEKEKKIAKEIAAKDEGKEENKGKSVPAVSKVAKKGKGKVEVVELEREYVIPLKKGVLKVPQYRRAKKAIRVMKEFLVRHMQVRDRDLRKVKIDMNLNEELWFRGIKKPANKIKVKAVKKGGIVYVELAEIPDYVKFKMAREEKKKLKKKKKKDKRKKKKKKTETKTTAEKKEEKEKEKASAEAGLAAQEKAAKKAKHDTQGSHANKTMPVRKTLK